MPAKSKFTKLPPKRPSATAKASAIYAKGIEYTDNFCIASEVIDGATDEDRALAELLERTYATELKEFRAQYRGAPIEY